MAVMHHKKDFGPGEALGKMRPLLPARHPCFQAMRVQQYLHEFCVLIRCADSCLLLMQFNIQSTTSSTLARMSVITIELERDECSIRSIADEPRCEFPVVPDRLVGEIPANSILPVACLGPCCCSCCDKTKQAQGVPIITV